MERLGTDQNEDTRSANVRINAWMRFLPCPNLSRQLRKVGEHNGVGEPLPPLRWGKEARGAIGWCSKRPVDPVAPGGRRWDVTFYDTPGFVASSPREGKDDGGTRNSWFAFPHSQDILIEHLQKSSKLLLSFHRVLLGKPWIGRCWTGRSGVYKGA